MVFLSGDMNQLHIPSLFLAGMHNIIFLEPQTIIKKWMEMVISNHFLCKGWVHHPIDSQPFINGWPWGSRYMLYTYNESPICLAHSSRLLVTLVPFQPTPVSP